MQKLGKRLGSLVLALLLMSSAQQATAPTYLSQEQMVAILVDLELAKALGQHHSDDAATLALWLNANAKHLYEEHATTPAAFQSSYQYYLTHPAMMAAIYQAVVEELEEYLNSL